MKDPKKKLASEVKVGDIISISKYYKVSKIKPLIFRYVDVHKPGLPHGFTFEFTDGSDEFYEPDEKVKIATDE